MPGNPNSADVIVVGAGLSGLATAVLLLEAGRSVQVLEANARPGGRIRSVFDEKTGAYVADLGPTWVWPEFQPVIGRWLKKLRLETFPQYDSGETVLDLGPDQPARSGFIPGQPGNMRVAGGSQALVDALVERLPESAVRTGTRVRSVQVQDGNIVVQTDNPKRPEFAAKQIAVALPPRIALQTIDWKPALPRELAKALDTMPTWMAPHAKVAVLYETAFWRKNGLSGRIASRSGPIVEGHDHCAADGSRAAIWGFVGWPHDTRRNLGDELERQIRLQLKRCFGDDAPEPLAVHIEDWSADTLIASPADLSGPMHHPSVGPDALRRAYCDGSVVFAGSETAQVSPGLIEGAFDAAERAAASLLTAKTDISLARTGRSDGAAPGASDQGHGPAV